MKEYPSTHKTINLNNKDYIIKMLTLGIQCRLEDENIDVTYLDIINECTNIPDNILEFIPQDQLDIICDDIISFSSEDANTVLTSIVVPQLGQFICVDIGLFLY